MVILTTVPFSPFNIAATASPGSPSVGFLSTLLTPIAPPIRTIPAARLRQRQVREALNSSLPRATAQVKIIAHSKLRFDSDWHPFYDANGPVRRLPSAMLSVPHMIVVFIVVLVVFGPQKLPELARGLAKLMAEFRKASTDFKSAFEEEMREMERQTLQAGRKKAAEAAAASAAAVETSPAPATAESFGSDAPSSEAQPEGRATEAPVSSPVAESVPRSSEGSGATPSEGASVTSAQEPPHNS